MIAIAIFLTYALQFYVPFEIIWRKVKPHCKNHEMTVEYSLRIVLVIGTGKQFYR
jgi:solute carrier family 36 (proton-coupled amino acid transporter)